MKDEEMAEEWVKENMDCCKTDNSVNQPIPYFSEEERCIAKSAFQDGAEFGYNKANEWHYVKDGDLPKNENRVWLCFGVDDYFGGQFIRGSFWCDSCGWIDVEEVIAWKEIVLPELPKGSE